MTDHEISLAIQAAFDSLSEEGECPPQVYCPQLGGWVLKDGMPTDLSQAFLELWIKKSDPCG